MDSGSLRHTHRLLDRAALRASSISSSGAVSLSNLTVLERVCGQDQSMVKRCRYRLSRSIAKGRSGVRLRGLMAADVRSGRPRRRSLRRQPSAPGDLRLLHGPAPDRLGVAAANTTVQLPGSPDFSATSRAGWSSWCVAVRSSFARRGSNISTICPHLPGQWLLAGMHLHRQFIGGSGIACSSYLAHRAVGLVGRPSDSHASSFSRGANASGIASGLTSGRPRDGTRVAAPVRSANWSFHAGRSSARVAP